MNNEGCETNKTTEAGSGGPKIPDFRVGDEVYCLSTGKGVIVQITKGLCNLSYDNDYPIKVKFNHDGYDEYTIFGQLYTDKDFEGSAPRCLFHEKGFKFESFEIVPKRTKKVWLNIYLDNYDLKTVIGNYYLTRQEADLHSYPNRVCCIETEIPENKIKQEKS